MELATSQRRARPLSLFSLKLHLIEFLKWKNSETNMHQNQHIFSSLFLHFVGEDPVQLKKLFKKEEEVDFYTFFLQILDHYSHPSVSACDLCGS